MGSKRGITLCASPMERMLAEAFAGLARFEWATGEHPPLTVGVWPGWFLALVAQVTVDRYRIDFGIMSYFDNDPDDPPFVMAVEVDGHAFHEKTKEQAAHDRRRDRFMTKHKIPFLRFTGSEVFRDAESCAAEALEFAMKLQQPNLDRRFKEYLELRATTEGWRH